MKKQLLFLIGGLFYTGACLAQAPVVDLSNPQATPPPPSQDLSRPSVSTQSISNGALADRLAVIERIVESRTDAQLRMQSQLDELQNDIDTIKGSIELHNHQLEKLLERQRELYLELDKRFANIQQSTNSLQGDITSINPSQATPSANTGNEQAEYQAAVNLILKDKDYAKAVPAFETFLSKYPNSELSANAHYWLGQLLYNQQEYTGAKVQFEAVANKFADSPKRGDSLLKLGLIEKSGGNLSAAISLFEQVVNEYPNSTPARLAQQQLAN